MTLSLVRLCNVDRRRTKYCQVKIKCPRIEIWPSAFCPPLIQRGLAWDRTRAPTGRGRWLADCAVARPFILVSPGYSHAVRTDIGVFWGMTPSPVAGCHFPRNVLSLIVVAEYGAVLPSGTLSPSNQTKVWIFHHWNHGYCILRGCLRTAYSGIFGPKREGWAGEREELCNW